MSATHIYARVSLIAAAVVGAGSFLGSAFKLVQIGHDADMGPAAYTVPVSLDLVAMTAALVRLTKPGSLGARLFARVCLFVPTAISCSVQVAAVPESGSPMTTLIHRIVAGAPAIAAATVFELALIAGEAGCAVPAPIAVSTDEGASAAPPAPPAAPLPVAATGNAPARRRRVSYLELLPVAERVAAELAADGTRLSRRVLQRAMDAAGHPVTSSRTATKLLAHLGSTWDVEGVAA